LLIAGDFNAVTNPQLDKSQTNKSTKHHCRPTSDTIRYLSNNQFIDTFCEIHPTKKTFSWSNSRNNHSRIDQIWINSSIHWMLLEANICQIDPNILNTDHKLATCTIEVWDLNQGTQTSRLKQPNNKFDWNQISSEQ
jgi:exonuclease III